MNSIYGNQELSEELSEELSDGTENESKSNALS